MRHVNRAGEVAFAFAGKKPRVIDPETSEDAVELLVWGPTRGGVATTLNEIARQGNVGIRLEEAAIPVDEEVRGACEILGLDPLYVANEGKCLVLVDPASADAALAALRAHPLGVRAAMIGEVTGDHPGKVFLKSRIGGQRMLDLLTGEQLPRIC